MPVDNEDNVSLVNKKVRTDFLNSSIITNGFNRHQDINKIHCIFIINQTLVICKYVLRCFQMNSEKHILLKWRFKIYDVKWAFKMTHLTCLFSHSIIDFSFFIFSDILWILRNDAPVLQHKRVASPLFTFRLQQLKSLKKLMIKNDTNILRIYGLHCPRWLNIFHHKEIKL